MGRWYSRRGDDEEFPLLGALGRQFFKRRRRQVSTAPEHIRRERNPLIRNDVTWPMTLAFGVALLILFYAR